MSHGEEPVFVQGLIPEAIVEALDSVNRFVFIIRSHIGGLYSCAVLFAGVTSRALTATGVSTLYYGNVGFALPIKAVRQPLTDYQQHRDGFEPEAKRT
jgi:hypothetical protein